MKKKINVNALQLKIHSWSNVMSKSRRASMPEKGLFLYWNDTPFILGLCLHWDVSTQWTTASSCHEGLANLDPSGGLMTVWMRSSLESNSGLTSDFKAFTDTQQIIPSSFCPVIMGMFHFRRRGIHLRAVGMVNNRWHLLLLDHMINLCHGNLHSSSLDSDSCIVKKNFLKCIKTGHCR